MSLRCLAYKGPVVHVFRTFNHFGSTDCGLPHSASASGRIKTDQPAVKLDRLRHSLFYGDQHGVLDNLASNLLAIFHYSAVSITVILLCNIAALFWLERSLPWRHNHQQEKLPSRIAMALESLKLCGVVVLGFLLGLSGLAFLKHATEASEYTLIFLLF